MDLGGSFAEEVLLKATKWVAPPGPCPCTRPPILAAYSGQANSAPTPTWRAMIKSAQASRRKVG
jgi:hypothetical protein